MKKKTLVSLLLALSATVLPAQNARQIHADYSNRLPELAAFGTPDALGTLQIDAQVRDALEFLYAYMPWPDVADYTLAYHTAQTECALRARREMPWGKTVPDREWMHFVLPVRVNNENLDNFRTQCYEELKQRVQGLTMEEAVKEVNHWCHEHVTYKPSDARTSSPLASMRTATGRCGEESTFTVAALRTIGIPARQVYTPRWAHTDDNHAWVEAWVDGKWCFLGACEPEPVLNLGWFNQPASRGMLMHTKVFGRYDGPEDVISSTACYTEINVTANYARTARTTVQVTDAAGAVVPDAQVEFKVYNYGELFTVQRTCADAQGHASILTGLGDMVVWAAKDGVYGFTKFTAGKDGTVNVSLTRKAGDSFQTDLTLVPPASTDNMPYVSPEAAAENVRRMAYEDSVRTAYVHTFADSASTEALCRETRLDYSRVRPFVVKSCGNWRNLFELLRQYPDEATLRLLATLSDKDLRDFDPAVLTDHLRCIKARGGVQLNEQQTAFQYKYVYGPRITNEFLSPWRGYFAQIRNEAGKLARKSPAKLATWIEKNIKDNARSNPLSYTLSPEKAFEGRRADARNRGILFVAVCRAQNIPARIDEVTGEVQYVALQPKETFPTEETAQWQTVTFGKHSDATASGTATLRLDYTPRRYMENPSYYYHFTLSGIDGGMPSLLNYPEGDTWKSTFSKGTAVRPGDYLLTSGTRMADGTVLARLQVFHTDEGKADTETLVMREDKQGVQVIGNFNAENRYYDVNVGAVKSILSTTGRGYYVTGLIRANHEPSNHILHDIEKLRAELEAWGRPILLLFPTQDEFDRFQKNRAEFTNLPATLSFGIDTEGSVQADLFGSGLTASRELPLVVIADTFNRVVFSSQGYTISLGEQIKQTVGKLQ